MARKSKTNLENDIERSRWEEKWEHTPKLVEQLSSRTTTESSVGETCYQKPDRKNERKWFKMHAPQAKIVIYKW